MHRRALELAGGLVGLVTLGQGLFIAARIVPHERPWLGLLLVALGAAMLWRARLPTVTRLPLGWIGAGAAAAAGATAAYNLSAGSSFDVPEIAIVALGTGTAAAAWVARAKPTLTGLRAALGWSLPLAWPPLGVWALQAFTKAGGGTTPLELFLRYGLVTPMAAALHAFGWNPTVDGQVIRYATPRGTLALEVGVACSGLQAMALFGAVIGAYVLARRPPRREALAWSAVGLGGVYVVNVIRLVALGVVGYHWGTDALQWAHANLGWMFFVAWTCTFALLVTRKPAAPGGVEAMPDPPEGGPAADIAEQADMRSGAAAAAKTLDRPRPDEDVLACCAREPQGAPNVAVLTTLVSRGWSDAEVLRAIRELERAGRIESARGRWRLARGP